MRNKEFVLGVLVLSVVGLHLLLAQNPMTFFITSKGPGDGANLGGLAGADKHCQNLATAAGAGNTWRAYLSTTAADGQPAVNARDRIGKGPWYNAKGVRVADDVADLHSDKNKLGKQTSLTEKGEVVNGRGDTPNRHDILTGSQLDGTALTGDPIKTTCGNWTSSSADGSTRSDIMTARVAALIRPHGTSLTLPSGCSQENLRATGGDGLFYCFAAN